LDELDCDNLALELNIIPLLYTFEISYKRVYWRRTLWVMRYHYFFRILLSDLDNASNRIFSDYWVTLGLSDKRRPLKQ
jgi:hypothetical protein